MLLVLLAAGLRGVYLWDNLVHNPFSRLLVLDSAHYDLWAVDIAKGNWLGQEVFLQAPLYPYLLGLLYWLVGRHLWLVYLLQHLLGLLNIYLVWRVGRRWFTERVALLGAALFAFYPLAAFVEGKMLVETLYLTLSLLVLDLAGELAERPGWLLGVALGLVSGLATVARANGSLLAVIAAGWVAWQLRGRGARVAVARAGLVLAFTALVVAPVTVRNWVVGGCFVPVSAGGGVAFARSNVLGGRGGFEPAPELPDSVVRSLREISSLAEAELGHAPTAREVSAFWVQRTLAKLQERPADWLRLEAWKLLRVVDTYEHGTENPLSEERPLTPVLWCFFVPAGVILAFGFAGMVAGWWRAAPRLLLYLYVALIVVGMLAFAVVGRYRLPMMPVLALFAAEALTSLGNFARERNWGRTFAVGGPVAVLLVVSFFQPDGVYRRQTIRVWLNLAAVQQLASHHEAAIDIATRILTIDPGVGRAYLVRGRSFYVLEHRREAEADLRRATDLVPKAPDAPMLLAALLVEEGRPAEALPFAERAVQLDPEKAFGWNALGGAYLELDRLTEAEEAFRQALALDGSLASARLGFAHALFSAGKFSEALVEYRQVPMASLTEAARAMVAERIRICRGRLSGGS
jgi:tetratricopeptide (TPR) repeat protein